MPILEVAATIIVSSRGEAGMVGSSVVLLIVVLDQRVGRERELLLRKVCSGFGTKRGN